MKKFSCFLGIAALIFFSSYAGMKVERSVQDNLFFSAYDPQIKIKVASEFDYIGKVEKHEYKSYSTSFGGCNTHRETYIFGYVDNDILKKGVGITIMKTDKGYWQPNLFGNLEKKMASGFEKMHGERYQYCVNSSNLFNKKEEEFILNKEINVPGCLIWKAFARRVGTEYNIKIYIGYFEAINYNQNDKHSYRNKDWRNTNILTDKQKTYMREFINRSEKSFEILG